jgi:hypothetical protein
MMLFLFFFCAVAIYILPTLIYLFYTKYDQYIHGTEDFVSCLVVASLSTPVQTQEVVDAAALARCGAHPSYRPPFYLVSDWQHDKTSQINSSRFANRSSVWCVHVCPLRWSGYIAVCFVSDCVCCSLVSCMKFENVMMMRMIMMTFIMNNVYTMLCCLCFVCCYATVYVCVLLGGGLWANPPSNLWQGSLQLHREDTVQLSVVNE